MEVVASCLYPKSAKCLTPENASNNYFVLRPKGLRKLFNLLRHLQWICREDIVDLFVLDDKLYLTIRFIQKPIEVAKGFFFFARAQNHHAAQIIDSFTCLDEVAGNRNYERTKNGVTKLHRQVSLNGVSLTFVRFFVGIEAPNEILFYFGLTEERGNNQSSTLHVAKANLAELNGFPAFSVSSNLPLSLTALREVGNGSPKCKCYVAFRVDEVDENSSVVVHAEPILLVSTAKKSQDNTTIANSQLIPLQCVLNNAKNDHCGSPSWSMPEPSAPLPMPIPSTSQPLYYGQQTSNALIGYRRPSITIAEEDWQQAEDSMEVDSASNENPQSTGKENNGSSIAQPIIIENCPLMVSKSPLCDRQIVENQVDVPVLTSSPAFARRKRRGKRQKAKKPLDQSSNPIPLPSLRSNSFNEDSSELSFSPAPKDSLVRRGSSSSLPMTRFPSIREDPPDLSNHPVAEVRLVRRASSSGALPLQDFRTTSLSLRCSLFEEEPMRTPPLREEDDDVDFLLSPSYPLSSAIQTFYENVQGQLEPILSTPQEETAFNAIVSQFTDIQSDFKGSTFPPGFPQ